MKENFVKQPEPLKKQILLRLAGFGVGVAMLVLVLVYGGDWRFLLPCALLVLICLGGAVSLYDRCLQNKYVVIQATCTEIERIPLRRRIKSLYLRDEEFNIKLVGIRKIKNLVVGDMVRVYVTDNTAVYDLDGCKVICSYIAIEKVHIQRD